MNSIFTVDNRVTRQVFYNATRIWTAVLSVALITLLGCGTGSKAGKQNQPYFTSGSREADQRAGQTMAKHEQLAGSGEGAGETDVKKSSGGEAAIAQTKKSLYERLGSERGLTALVEDFIPRVLVDPRVNWNRIGAKRSGLFHRGSTATWNATPDQVAVLKKHMVQFLALATGGPAQYQGGEIKSVHAEMQISNPEFDAVIGDIKASLDKLQIPNEEQKELLAIVESTRPLIVTQR
jgi:hemoglobin